MEFEKYAELKKDVEVYFAEIIKKRFQDYVSNNFEFHFAPDAQSHNLISDLLRDDGFEVFGMNANMDGFELLLDFRNAYLEIDNFAFTRLSVYFNNDGNYSVYLDESSFDDEWETYLEDDWKRYYRMEEAELVKVLSDMKNMHLTLQLKKT
ncbi:MAG: hypothetical protein ACOYB0_02605 [Polynucleobacter sp.]